MCDLGWPGIAISEEYGGQGLGVVELMILLEELGYALAPSPFISNALAGALIEAGGSDEQKAQAGCPASPRASGEARPRSVPATTPSSARPEEPRCWSSTTATGPSWSRPAMPSSSGST